MREGYHGRDKTLLRPTTILTVFNFMSSTGETQIVWILSLPHFWTLAFAINALLTHFVVKDTASKAGWPTWPLHHWHGSSMKSYWRYSEAIWTVLGTWLEMALLEQGELDQKTARGPFQAQAFCDIPPSVTHILLGHEDSQRLLK